MRNMGALARKLPFTFATFLVATLALCGIPPFAGFFSKDEILWQAWSAPGGSPRLWLVGLAASGLTAFYMFRAIYLTFFGTSRVAQRLAGERARAAAFDVDRARRARRRLARRRIHRHARLSCASSSASRRRSTTFSRRCSPRRLPQHHAASTEIALMAIALARGGRGHLPGVALLRSRRPRVAGRRKRRGRVEQIVSRGYFFDAVYEGVFVRFADWLSESVLARGLETAVAKVSLGAACGRRAPRVAAACANCRPATCRPTSSMCSWVSRSRSGGD